MPGKRVTRSYSRRSLFGGRVRYTESYNVPSADEWTAIKAERRQARADRRAERVASFVAWRQQVREERAPAVVAGRQRDIEQHAAAMRAPKRIVAWLHTPIGIATLTLATLIAIVGASNGIPEIGGLMIVALLVADWHNMVTLHGWIRWRTLWAGSPLITLLIGVAMPAVLSLSPIIYTIQAAGTMKTMREARRAQLHTDIVRLEQELSQHEDQPHDTAPKPSN